jgi:hypothetical protein
MLGDDQIENTCRINSAFAMIAGSSVAVFLSRFFITWEIKYIKPPKYLAR